MRTLIGLTIVAALILPAYGQGPLNMSGTWELVREKSSPRPQKLCDPNSWVAGLKGEPCVRAMAQLAIDEAPEHLTVTGAVPFMYTTFPVTLELRDAFAPLGTIDRSVARAIRSTDAIVVRFFLPEGQGCDAAGAAESFVSDATRAQRSIPETFESLFDRPPGRALQCLEMRFTLDRSGGLTIEVDESPWKRVTHQVYRRVR